MGGAQQRQQGIASVKIRIGSFVSCAHWLRSPLLLCVLQREREEGKEGDREEVVSPPPQRSARRRHDSGAPAQPRACALPTAHCLHICPPTAHTAPSTRTRNATPAWLSLPPRPPTEHSRTEQTKGRGVPRHHRRYLPQAVRLLVVGAALRPEVALQHARAEPGRRVIYTRTNTPHSRA